jgi:diadenosine tetraphosphatase ApaH/serine/threonine PP2A family protein phosphatase
VRLAVFSDVHANLEALEAVAATDAFRGAGRVVCLGDVVGYGADPSACLAFARRASERILLGNHESAIAHPEELAYFNGFARQAIEWTRDQLSVEEREFVAGLPASFREPPDFLFVHSAPTAPHEWEYIFDLAGAQREIESVEETLCFVGHSHVPLAIEKGAEGPARLLEFPFRVREGHRYLINVGSVGQPRDSDPRAAFVTFDSETRTVSLERVEYPIAIAQEKILAAGLPAFLAARLAKGR